MFKDCCHQHVEGMDGSSRHAVPASMQELPCQTRGISKTVLKQASVLFVRMQSTPGTESEQAISDWLSRSPCHQCSWQQVKGVWGLLGGAGTRVS
jgi:ferric-dicitrate binding protein FerR (iron transport regulator)